jgi:hypothetical protein
MARLNEVARAGEHANRIANALVPLRRKQWRDARRKLIAHTRDDSNTLDRLIHFDNAGGFRGKSLAPDKQSGGRRALEMI